MNPRVARMSVIVALILAASVVTCFVLTGRLDGLTFHHSLIVYAAVGLVVQQMHGARLRSNRLQSARARVNTNRRQPLSTRSSQKHR